jgi:hypothetical protein
VISSDLTIFHISQSWWKFDLQNTHGSWIYNYLYNHRVVSLNHAHGKVYSIHLCDNVCQWFSRLHVKRFQNMSDSDGLIDLWRNAEFLICLKKTIHFKSLRTTLGRNSYYL